MGAPSPFPTAVARYPRVRQSILATYDNCALSTRFDLELRQGWSSHPAAAGTVLHRVFEKCLREMVAQNESRVPVEVALAVLDECLRQHDVPMLADPLDDDVVTVPLRWIAEMRIIVKTWANNLEWDVSKIAAVEERLSTMLRYPDANGELVEREFTGRPDVLKIDGLTAEVDDWKTGWGIPSEGAARSPEELASSGDNISEEGYFWMRSYALLVFREYPRIQRVVLREIYPRYLSGRATDSKGRPINPVRQATIDRYELPEIETELNALIERFDRSIEANVWKPSPGSHCSYCPQANKCTIFPTARAEGEIETPEHAEIIAGRLNVLKALSKQATGKLRAWSEVHGPVPIKDAKRPRVYGPVVRVRNLKPSAEDLAAHVAAGGNPEELFRAEEYVAFTVHSPEEQHPTSKAAAEEEERLLEEQRAKAAAS